MKSKKLQPAMVEEEEEEAEAPLLKKGKQTKGPTVARTATRQTTISTGVVIRERVIASLEAHLAATASTPIPVASPVQHPKQRRRKRACPKKEVDFLGRNEEELVGEVLEALPPKTAAVAVAHNKYWTET